SLVQEAERILAGGAPDPAVIRAALAPLRAQADLDTVVLGCTPFPLLGEHLAAALPRRVRLVDSSEAIARLTLQVAAAYPRRVGRDRRLATAPAARPARVLAALDFDAPSHLPAS